MSFESKLAISLMLVSDFDVIEMSFDATVGKVGNAGESNTALTLHLLTRMVPFLINIGEKLLVKRFINLLAYYTKDTAISTILYNAHHLLMSHQKDRYSHEGQDATDDFFFILFHLTRLTFITP